LDTTASAAKVAVLAAAQTSAQIRVNFFMGCSLA
jgi:hypothetical protein